VLQPQRWLFTLLITGFLGAHCLNGFRHARQLQALERLPRHPGFSCPDCRMSPPGGPLWRCPGCQQGFDPFSTGGLCPHCGTARQIIPCPHCGNDHPASAWGLAPRAGPGGRVIDI
jgi:hypothetical protein